MPVALWYLLIEDDLVKQAILQAMKQCYPYEEPAYGVWKLEDL